MVPLDWVTGSETTRSQFDDQEYSMMVIYSASGQDSDSRDEDDMAGSGRQNQINIITVQRLVD